MTKRNAIGNTLLTLLRDLFLGPMLLMLCTGLWGYRGDVISRLELEATWF